jgi:hypothetical protein
MPDWKPGYAVTCPACNARIGEPCTAPTNTGRRPVSWTHLARDDAARLIFKKGVDES